MTSRRHISAILPILTGVATLVAVSGCASSPKADLIAGADKKCDTIHERFTGKGDLAYGEGIGGADDLKKMTGRSKLIKDLARDVRAMPAPESGQKDLKAWLGKLDAYAKETDTMRNLFMNATMGMDMLLAVTTNIVKEAAEATGPPAKRFGLHSCADVKKWEALPS